MTEVLPFRGIRFNQNKIDNLWSVLSPPWDKITPEKASTLRAGHPNNIAHVLVPGPQQSEPSWPASARLVFEQWLKDGVVKQDPKPMYYGVRETFYYDGEKHQRIGFFGLCRLGPPEVSGVYPHERVFPDHYQTRLDLLRKTETNFGPVFLIYPDPELRTQKLIDVAPSPEDILVEDPEQGFIHELWQIKDQEVIGEIREMMAQRDLVIADGHHRYGSAEEYSREWHERHPGVGKCPVDFRMAYMAPMETDGLLILPTHRVFKELGDRVPDPRGEKFSKYFTCLSDSIADVDSLTKAMDDIRAQENAQKVLGLYDGKKYLLMQWNSTEPPSYKEHYAKQTQVWKSLDVNVLHEILLPYVFDWDRDKGTDTKWASHFREADGAVNAVDSQPGSLAVFLNRTSRYEVLEVAQAGEKMPQKSTDFYPKIPTGLIFRKIENELTG